MKTKIVSEKNNPHLGRRELNIEIDHLGGATPSAAALQHLLAKEFGTNPEKVDIKNIYSMYGKSASRSKVHLWNEDKVADLMKKAEKPAEAEAAPAADGS